MFFGRLATAGSVRKRLAIPARGKLRSCVDFPLCCSTAGTSPAADHPHGVSVEQASWMAQSSTILPSTMR